MAVNYNKQSNKLTSLEEKLKKANDEVKKLSNDNSIISQALHGTLHEIRRFSAEISNYSDQLSRSVVDQDFKVCDELAKTIMYTSGLISSRLAFTDIELNPKAICFQELTSSGIYKKFEKSSHILKQRAKNKQVNIVFRNKSFMEIETLPSFELVPFVILENAVKYSPNNQVIEVHFDEAPNMRSLKVSVNSVGPTLNNDEIPFLFDRGVRGSNAKRLSVAGEGLGLFLVKFLCDYHDVVVKVSSSQDNSYALANIPYNDFSIQLQFSK